MNDRLFRGKLTEAISLFRAGELTRAQHVCNEILREEPKHFEALHLLGLIAQRTGEARRAVEMFGQAVLIDPRSGPAQTDLGNALLDLREYALALQCYDKAIAADPNYAESYFGRANALLDLGQCEAAVEDFDRAILRNAGHALAFANRGIALASRIGIGKRTSAASNDLDPSVDLALQSFERAIAINPACAEAHYNRGRLLQEVGRLDAALASYDKAIELRANYAEAHSNRGTILLELLKPDDALRSFDRAIAIRPSFAQDHSNRGAALLDLSQVVDALESFSRAIAIKPDYAEGHSNHGFALHKMLRLDEALRSFQRAIAFEPDHAEAIHNRAITRLVGGQFADGWIDYEWRWKIKKGPPKRNFVRPLWTGEESPKGKTILLHAEQGLGDTIQFCRYARMVADRGAKVLLQVPGPVYQLLQTLEGVSQLVPWGGSCPEFDFHCPLLTLPMAFNTTLDNIPAPNRYLHSEPVKVEYWRARLGGRARPRIGLVWSGNPDHGNDRNRSIPLSDVIPHLPAGAQYISLQKEPRGADAETLMSAPNILNWGTQLGDFSDTAALCECLDLVISVDTSVAHLSAALGLETWILLPFCPDWRWLLDRDDSLWYPTARLFRQPQIGDWKSVLLRLRADLAAKSNWRGPAGGESQRIAASPIRAYDDIVSIQT